MLLIAYKSNSNMFVHKMLPEW